MAKPKPGESANVATTFSSLTTFSPSRLGTPVVITPSWEPEGNLTSTHVHRLFRLMEYCVTMGEPPLRIDETFAQADKGPVAQMAAVVVPDRVGCAICCPDKICRVPKAGSLCGRCSSLTKIGRSELLIDEAIKSKVLREVVFPKIRIARLAGSYSYAMRSDSQ